MGNILYLDTSNKMARVCMFNSENVWIERSNTIDKDHGKMIMKHIDEVLHESKIEMKTLSAIAVMNGPGSYTGLRISLATAKGICFTHNIPLILINNLDIIAHASKEYKSKYAIMQAREDEYFVGHYNTENEHILNPVLMYLNDFLEYFNQNFNKIFSSDPDIKLDTLNVEMTEISNSDLKSFIFNSLNKQNFANLFQSEPFYLKNVFINKINKL